MTRALSQFKGEGVVIGCSHFHTRCNGEFHEGQDNFYTIDLCPSEKPDFRFNITHELPEEFKSKFKLTFIEHLDDEAYNEVPYLRKKHGIQGFKNIWDMTKEDGFIVIRGCPPLAECRRSIAKLRYIELDSKGKCVLLPKNQNLSYVEVVQQINALPPRLKKTIDKCRIHRASPNQEQDFCKLDYESLPTFRELLRSSPINVHDMQARSFRKIYLALYQGQSSLFKHKSALLNEPLASVSAIEAYVARNPDSRSAVAWSLAKVHCGNTTSSNEDLFKAIHRYAFQRSSSLFGLFKRSKNFTKENYENFQNKKDNADPFTRTGIICKHLDTP